MANIKTVNLLPQVFRTDTNRKFLNATMDQLVSRPDLKKINGYIGRTFAPTNKSSDNYIQEITTPRQNYQLEPSVVVSDKSKNINFYGNYIDLLQQINYLGGITTDQNRLFANETYSFNGLFDFDKLVNFNQYYWLPDGPAAVDVVATGVPITNTYTVTRDQVTGAYKFSGYGAETNPQVVLVHGGVYQFVVDQPGYPFYIQSDPGVSGTRRNQPNTSSRNVLGVTNNGVDVGTVTFRVPAATAQDNFASMSMVDQIDFAIDVPFNEINNQMVSYVNATYNGLDGIETNWQGKKIIFLDKTNADDVWTSTGIFDFEALDTVAFENSSLVVQNLRYSVWTIQLLDDGAGNQIVRLVNPQPIVALTQKVFVSKGATNANNEYFVNRNGQWELIPDITASSLYLYYQDGIEESFAGRVKLTDPLAGSIDVTAEILGKQNYTSPNGVVFTNGLKIQFDVNVTPAEYVDTVYYVEGVGSAIRLVMADQLIKNDIFQNQPDYITINRASIDRNSWSRNNRWFHIDVINATAEYQNTIASVNQTQRALRPIIEFDADIQLYNSGTQAVDAVGTIVIDTVTNALVQIEGQLADSATETLLIIGELEFTVINGERIIFAADTDLITRNKIYTVQLADLNSDVLNPDYRVTLVETGDVAVNGITAYVEKVVSAAEVVTDSQYYFDGNVWIQAQQKTSLNQAPLFGVYTENNTSLTDNTLFLNSTFAGTKLFSYRPGAGVTDQILGFPLSYRNFNNVGDIQFDNNFDNDTFTSETRGFVTEKIHNYYLRQNVSLDQYQLKNIWTKTAENSKQYQLFNYNFDGTTNYFEIDILPEVSLGVPTLIVYKNNAILDPSTYAIVSVGARVAIRISIGQLTVGDLISLRVFSKSVSNIGFYEVPKNLDLNSINSNFETLTLGQLRNHLVTISYNSNFVTGTVPGVSNIRDLQIKQQGGSILQHSAPAIYSNLFLLDKNLNFVKSIELAQKEYSKFKNKFLELAVSSNLVDINNIVGSVDVLLQQINRVKNNKFPWYYSDMVPYGNNKQTLEYVVLNPQLRRYEIATIFDDTQLSNRAVVVYYHTTQKDQYGNIVTDLAGAPVVTSRRQLLKNRDFVFEQDRPAIRLLESFTQLYNDVVVVNDYANTDGSFIPETPTKLGLYPAYFPEIFVDSTYVSPTTVIQGHDGSITPSFGDYRDDLLLELERRIFNNLKTSYNVSPIDIFDSIPGRFRTVDYSLAEFNSIITQSFLKWVGTNRVDYITNAVFNPNNPFTWNYKNFKDILPGNQNLQGTWRAIYKYFYDTDRPHTNPWEMLGFASKPDWWNDRYGPAPYTGGNLVLWEDLANGYIYGEDRVDQRYARKIVDSVTGQTVSLLDIIPVDDSGNLRSPESFLVKNFDSAKANTSYSVGDIGPTENAWRRSSDYPFVIQMAIALTRPGVYFGTAININRYNVNTVLGQFALENSLQRITPDQIQINGVNYVGQIERTAGYINWIGDYLTNLGYANPGTKIKEYFDGLDVRLSYKLAGYTDKNYIKILAEQSSPTSTNESVIVPAENYEIYLNKSTPTRRINYSAVIVQKSAAGWTVNGYDLDNPYFYIIPSLANNNLSRIQVGDTVGIIYQDFQNYKVKIPYGFEFNSSQQLVDFLISYERYLIGQGMRFNQFNQDLQVQQDWTLSAREFLTWVQQGWRTGSLLILSPTIDQLFAVTDVGAIDEIENTVSGTKILDQNFNVIKTTQFTVIRDGSEFKLKTNNNQTIAYAQLNVVEYEHALIFDNSTLFNDIIYKPELGNRQYRLKLIGSKTAAWAGQLDIPGFVYNNEIVDEWRTGKDYQKGSLITFKNQYYVALQNVLASTDFVPSNWQTIEKDSIKTGLLNNFTYNAGILENVYDINNQPADSRLNQFSNGLLGFRERDYLTDLGLDVDTQTKFYQGYIKQKGTKNAVNALSTVELSNLTSALDIFEEWGLRVGEYGAIDSNDYVEVTLEEGLFNQDPSTFVLIRDSETVQDQLIGVRSSDLYRRPNNYNPAILRAETNPNDRAKPLSAGYVNLSDVDSTIFDLQNYAELYNVLSAVGNGYKIWVAKDFDGDWNVYRVSETGNFVTGYEYNLNTLIKITTFDPHNFSAGDMIAIRNFDEDFDGFYRVFELFDSNSFFVIAARNEALIQEVGQVYGSGIIFRLTSVRAETSMGIIDLEPPYYWRAGDRIWADDDRGTGNWSVYEKSDSWAGGNRINLSPGDYSTGSQYGASVRLNENSTTLIVGAPGVGGGLVRTFARAATGDVFSQATAIQSAVAYAQGFGSSVDIGSSVVVVGAPQTLSDRGIVFVYNYSPAEGANFITAIRVSDGVAGHKFGTSVSISRDDRWLYIGAPGADAFYAYTLTTVATPQNSIFNKLSGSYDQTAANVIVNIATHGFTVPVGTYSQTGSTVTVTSADHGLKTGQPIWANVQSGTSDVGAYTVSSILDSNTFTYTVGTPTSTTGNIDVWPRVNVYVTSGVAVSGYANVNAVIDADNFRLDSNIVVTSAGTLTVTSYTLDYAPQGSDTISVVGQNRIYIADIDYTVNDRVIDFVSVDGSDSVVATESTYYKLVANIAATAANQGQFGQTVKSSTDGAQILVGAPTATVESQTNAGVSFVYDRVKEGFYSDGITTTFVPRRTLGTSYRVTVNGADAIEGVDYNKVFNSIVFTSILPGGQFVEIEVNEFIVVDKLGAAQARTSAKFGTALDMCPNNCSLYVSAPFYTRPDYFAGIVYQYVNQGRVYGTILGKISSPYIQLSGTYLQNGIGVTVTAAAHGLSIGNVITVDILSGISESGTYTVTGVDTKNFSGTYAQSGTTIVTVTSIGHTLIPGDTVTVSITSGAASSGQFIVSTTPTADTFTYVSSTVQTTSGTSIGVTVSNQFTYVSETPATASGQLDIQTSILRSVVAVNDSVRINGVEVAFTGTTVQAVADDINGTSIPGITATVENGQLRINSASKVSFKVLELLPGSGNALAGLGLVVYALTQSIEHPYTDESEYFGTSLKISDTAGTLFVSSRGADTRSPLNIDLGETIFDEDSTRFANFSINSGTVYAFDYINRSDDTIDTPGQFAFVQQLSPDNFVGEAFFGSALDVNKGFAAIGASFDNNILTQAGEVYVYNNLNNRKAWSVVRQKEDKVNLESLNKVFLYNRVKQEILSSLDYYDPLKGKILGIAEQELDFVSSFDPARYNQQNPTIDVNTPQVGPINFVNTTDVGTVASWGKENIGKLWWNLDAVRYIDYEQDSLTYRSKTWGTVFPGSAIEVCEWIESDLPPGSYVGEGTVKFPDNTKYSISYYVDKTTGLVKAKYYYWVFNKFTTMPGSIKLKSAGSVAEIIANPQTAGVPYVAAIRNDAFNLYHVNRYLSGSDTILQINYNLIDKDNNIIHSEYELIKENSPVTNPQLKIIQKFLDSLCGVTIDGSLVPDPSLPESQKYGISSRPRQSVFIDRITALANFVGYINSILIQVPIVVEFDNQRLYTADPVPATNSGVYDEITEIYENLDYLDNSQLPIGYKILVLEDTRHSGLWTISELDAARQWNLIRIQTYRTDFFVELVDWYASVFDRTQQISYTVNTLAEATTLPLIANDVLLVNNDGSGRFAYYIVNQDLTLSLVGLQRGTVQIKESLWNLALDGASFDTSVFDTVRFDQNPTDEIRSIATAIVNDIFVKSLSPQFGQLIFTLLNYILSEQKSVDWIFKTSFISVLHKIRKLDQYPNFVRDNQTYYLDYINEVKPYRTQVREYLLNYTGSDEITGNVTDFDLPGYYDSLTNTYRSPTGLGQLDEEIYQQLPYQYWYNAHKYQVSKIELINAGTGYQEVPVITVVGGGGTGATASAQIDLLTGTISSISIINPGTGYTTTPQVIINGYGSRDTGARLTPLIGINGATPWTPTGSYSHGTVLSYLGNTYVAANSTANVSGQSFGFPNWSNTDSRSGRVNSAIVEWAANLVFDTETYVLSFNNNVYIANTEVASANLFANSSAFFPFANAVAATTANVTFNFGNVTEIDVSGQITSVVVVNQGSGFTVDPIAEVYGSGVQANIQIDIDAAAGIISNVIIVDGGSGYISGETFIRVLDPNTEGSAVARLRNVYYRSDPDDSYNTTRSFDTRLKFDRTTYTSNVQVWAPNVVYYLGDTVSYAGEAWRANTAVTWANVIYPSNVLVAYDGNILVASNASSSISAISLTFANAVNGNTTITYNNATVVEYDSAQTYAANTIVQFGVNYYINSNATANISGLSYTFPGLGTILNANVTAWSNLATYSFDSQVFSNSNVFAYIGNVYVLANASANAAGRSFDFPAWSNAAARASRINANVVAWEPGIVYDTTTYVIEYLGNVLIANTQVIGANLFANSARYFGNANVVQSTSSNLTFSSGNVIAATAQSVTFNPGNVILGVATITVNSGNTRIVPRANTIAWTPTASISPNTVFSINQETFISANSSANVSGRSFGWFYANNTVSTVRINANVVIWEPNTDYDTSNIVLDFLGNIVIANVSLVSANLFANSATFFPTANASIAGNSFVTYNSANAMPVDATIVPSAILLLDRPITYTKTDPLDLIGNLDLITVSTNEAVSALATGVATVSANIINSNLIFVTNTVGSLQSGTVHWLRTATQNSSMPEFTVAANLQAKVNAVTSVFDVTKYNRIDAVDFVNANDRTMAYYQPGVGMPARSLTQLFSGIEYPGVQINSPKYESNVSVSTDVLRFFSTNNTITTADVQAFNFEREDFGSGQTISIAGSAFNNGSWVIGTVKDNAITVFGASRQSLTFGISQTFVITTVPNPEGAGAIYQVDGVNKPVLNLVRGGVYTFDQSAATNNNHPIAFRDSANNSYTLGVVTTGTPGTAGAQTVFTVPSNAPDSLRYYCTVHGNGMGNTITVTDSGRQSLTDENVGANVTITYFNENSPLYLDTVIQSNYADTGLGLRPEDINLDGGKYVDEYSSHAPEELVPGRVFDNLNIEVYTLMRSGTANVGYRMTHGMTTEPNGVLTAWPLYYRINGANTAILSANLNYTDSNIYVSNATLLPAPNPDGARPGVVFINGEKIYYYRNVAREVLPWVANVAFAATDIVSYLGNTYVAANANVTVTGATFNLANVKLIDVNVLTQIRRGVDGTGIANTHVVGSRVVDSGLDQLVPGRAHELTWLNAPTSGGDTFETDAGDFIVDNFASNIVTAAPEENSVTDGAGLEGSSTLQARYIKLATVD